MTSLIRIQMTKANENVSITVGQFSQFPLLLHIFEFFSVNEDIWSNYPTSFRSDPLSSYHSSDFRCKYRSIKYFLFCRFHSHTVTQDIESRKKISS